MAIGGFNGSDPAPTLAAFQQRVARGRIPYFLTGAAGLPNGRADSSGTIAKWVEATFHQVSVDGIGVFDLSDPISAVVEHVMWITHHTKEWRNEENALIEFGARMRATTMSCTLSYGGDKTMRRGVVLRRREQRLIFAAETRGSSAM